MPSARKLASRRPYRHDPLTKELREKIANYYVTLATMERLFDYTSPYRDLIRWLVADYGFDELEAYFLLTQAGRMRVGNMVDPKYTLGASILKDYLPSK